MCGIVGSMSNFLSKPEIERFQDLMIVSNLRGRVGAGAIVVNAQNKVFTCKNTWSGIDLVDSDSFEKVLKKGTQRIIIGHTRLPTTGSSDDFNDIHPHTAGHIIGVHNGTMSEIAGKRVNYKDSDSRILFQSIADIGIDETIKTSIGAYALTWIDTKEGTLNFLRNGERPLFFGAAAEKQYASTVYWASESWMIWAVLSRKGTDKPHIWELPVNTLYRYPLDMGSRPELLEVREVKRPFPVYSPPFNGGSYVEYKSYKQPDATCRIINGRVIWVDNRNGFHDDHGSAVAASRTTNIVDAAVGGAAKDTFPKSDQIGEQRLQADGTVTTGEAETGTALVPVNPGTATTYHETYHEFAKDSRSRASAIRSQRRPGESTKECWLRLLDERKEREESARQGNGGNSHDSLLGGASIPHLDNSASADCKSNVESFMNWRKEKQERKKHDKLRGRQGHNAGHMEYLLAGKNKRGVNMYVSKEEMGHILSKIGCGWCGDKLGMEHYLSGKLFFFDEKEFLCDTCNCTPYIHDALREGYPHSYPELTETKH